MYEYKTEKIVLSTHFIEGDYIKDKDLVIMDEAFNSMQKDGWELVAYDFLSNDRFIKENTVIIATFKRKK